MLASPHPRWPSPPRCGSRRSPSTALKAPLHTDACLGHSPDGRPVGYQLGPLAHVILFEASKSQVILEDEEAHPFPQELVKRPPPIGGSLGRHENTVLQQEHLDVFPSLPQRPRQPQTGRSPWVVRGRGRHQQRGFHFFVLRIPRQ